MQDATPGIRTDKSFVNNNGNNPASRTLGCEMLDSSIAR
jgi:hypothetical protein